MAKSKSSISRKKTLAFSPKKRKRTVGASVRGKRPRAKKRTKPLTPLQKAALMKAVRAAALARKRGGSAIGRAGQKYKFNARSR